MGRLDGRVALINGAGCARGARGGERVAIRGRRMRQRIPVRRPGTPEEAAGAILLFCLPEADDLTGQVIEVDGGGP